MPKRYREYTLALLLLAAAALLVGVLLAEWLHYRHLAAEMRQRLAANVEVRLPSGGVGQERYELPGLDQYNATVERPLFMENRRPAEADAVDPELANVIRPPLSLKLMGVALTPKETLGLFIDVHGKYKRLRKGEAMDGWTLAEILPDKAIMEQDGNREELKLIKTKPKKMPMPPGPGPIPIPGGQPLRPGQIPGQPMPPPSNPNNPDIPQDPVDVEANNPNEPVDETVPPDDIVE